ncbi:MAG: hydrogenase 4 subunit B [Nitrospirae bacterium GWB2_47_37]|nr:MAG: hydrogenase 4 subunit B [Nitrospirae bacterium GWA2_46_11]OGW23714.1 MAG: hydrogenase 4 subunit B [Nitrospirae bacterium GWB2_47_37]
MMTPINIAATSVVLLLITGLSAGLLRRNQGLLIRVSFILSALASFMATASGIWTVKNGITEKIILPIGLPDLPFHLRLDALSGFFMTVIGLLSFFVSIYSIGYVKGFIGRRPVTRLVVFYCLFIAGMFMVTLADDALFFLVSWEIMAAASYFLVMFEDEKVENRRAAFLYMVVAHVGAIAILLSFGVMAGLSAGFESFSGFTFDAMRQAQFPVEWATVAFLLAFFGFAAKAGVIPLHVWLPEAHPVAPSNISALMSGVMLKTAIYGIVRVTFDLLRVFPWWWGAIVLTLGLVSAIMGVLYALMQHDLKKLLAYHSVENIGIILIGIGLAMIFTSFKMPMMAALALIAGLYHTLNHAMFKGLLFMGAGAVLHATHERNMEKMGGLIRRMPWTAVFFLVGCISISALPPFNGFVSEWLTFQAFLLSPSMPNQIMKLLMPMGAALLALTGALAAACFVKVFGVVFLGHSRGHHNQNIHEVDWSMRAGMMMASLTCLALGVLPTFFIEWTDVLSESLVGAKLSASAAAGGWLWLTPIAPERASYSGIIVFLGILAAYGIVYVVLHVNPGKIHRGAIWDCGFEKLTPRMQYNATSFAMPIRRIFGFLFLIKEDVQIKKAPHPAFPKRLHYFLRVRDRFWFWIYMPFTAAVFWIARKAGRFQQGRIQTYLIYSFLTLIVLLLVKSL